MCTLIWFRNDLRIENNRLLDRLKNSKNSRAIIIEEPEPYESIDDFIIYNKLKTDHRLTSIEQFKRDLNKLNINIEVLRGSPKVILPDYCQSHKIDRIYTSKLFDIEEQNAKKELEYILAKEDIFIDYIYNNTWIPIDELPFPIKRVPLRFKDFMKEIKGLETNFYDTEAMNVANEKEVIQELIQNIEDNNSYELKKYVYSPNNNFFKFLPELTLGKVSSPALLDWVKDKYQHDKRRDKIIKTFRQQLFMYDHIKLKYFADPELNLIKPAINRGPDVKAFQKWINGETKSPLINAIMKKLSSVSKISLTSKQLAIDYYNHVLQLPSFWGYWYFQKQLMEYSGEINSFLWKSSLDSNYNSRELNTKICDLSLRMDPKNNFTSYWSNL